VNGIMRIVGISGSPRKAGNTEFLLNEALAVIWLSDGKAALLRAEF
jgi:hypothetical protein